MAHLLRKHDLRVIDPKPSWDLFLSRGWAHRALLWVGQSDLERRVALQLSELRNLPAVPGLFRTAAPNRAMLQRVVEWRGTLGGYARAALGAGARVFMLPTRDGPAPGDASWPSGVHLCDGNIGPADLKFSNSAWSVVASLTVDSGEEATRLVAFLEKVPRLVSVWVDAPSGADIEPLVRYLARKEFRFSSQDLTGRECHDQVTRRRTLLRGIGQSGDPALLLPFPSLPPGQRYAVASWLTGDKRVPADRWIAGNLTLDRNPLHLLTGPPRSVGHVRSGTSPLKCAVWDTQCRLPGLHTRSCTPGRDGVALLVGVATSCPGSAGRSARPVAARPAAQAR